MTHPSPISSIQVRDHHADVVAGSIPGDRRSRVRFPFELRTRYRTLGRGEPFTGVGWVVNMSSGGVLVAYRHQIRIGVRVELSIEWPSLLDGQVPLQLVTMGRVIRSETSSFAMVVGRYQFRTTRRTVVPIDASEDLPTWRTVPRVASA